MVYKKYSTQNIFDFILTYLGSMDLTISFMLNNDIKNLAEFQDRQRIDKVEPKPNSVINYYQKNGIIVSTGTEAPLFGDYSNDFNIDFYN